MLKYDASERRLLRAREVMKGVARNRQCAWMINRHSLSGTFRGSLRLESLMAHFSARVNHKLGLTYSETGDQVKAELALRQAIEGMTEVARAFGLHEVGPSYKSATLKDIADAKESLAIVLKEQRGNAAKVEEMRLGNTHYVRRTLRAGATDAQERAFELAATETAPVDSADALRGMCD